MVIFRQPLPRNVWELLLDECSVGEIYDTGTIKPEERGSLVDFPWHVVQTLFTFLIDNIDEDIEVMIIKLGIMQ